VTWSAAFSLGNGGETVTLTCGVTVIDTVTYDDGAGWPTSTDGVSIQLSNDLLNATANDAPASWCLTAEGTTYGPDTMRRGTPGDANAMCAAAPVAPTVVSASASDATTVVVTFSEALDAATVAVGDFAFDMGLTASAVVIAGDGLSATLTTSTQTAGTTYTVTVTGVSDTMGTAIAGMNTATFTGFMPGGMGRLLISEYVEGGSSNKALEITNVGSASMTMLGCGIRTYNSSGASASNPGTTYNLPDVTLAAGESFVVCNSSSNPTLLALCDVSASATGVNNATGYNGDDAVELLCGGMTVDVIGVFGTRAIWGTGDITTQNDTLRRQCSVTMGDTDGTDAFDPADEWDGFPQDTFDGLGVHCP
jgi:hypothetical protein